MISFLSRPRRFALSLAAAVVVLSSGVLSSCGGSSSSEPVDVMPSPVTETEAVAATPTDNAPVEAAAERVAASEEPEAELDAEAVVAATLLIASGGDLEAAINAGLIPETEATFALELLDEGDASALVD